MNFKEFFNKSELNEAPIDTFKTLTVGKDNKISDDPEKFLTKNSSFGKRDLTSKKILTAPAAVHKIKNQFIDTVVNFDMYFLNSKEGIKEKEIGEVTPEFVKDKLNLDIPINKDNITVIYTNNSGDEKVMMSGWILGHRFGHAVNRSSIYSKGSKSGRAWNELIEDCADIFNMIFNECYNITNVNDDLHQSVKVLSKSGTPNNNSNDELLRSFFTSIGSFKSARTNNLRGYYEFYYELFAQYLTTNKINFREAPKHIKYRKDNQVIHISIRDEDSFELANNYLRDLAEYTYDGRAANVLYAAQGHIFVM